MYLYLWPQYHDTSPYAGRYLPASLWAYELATARSVAHGVVIWGPRADNTDAAWLGVLTGGQPPARAVAPQPAQPSGPPAPDQASASPTADS